MPEINVESLSLEELRKYALAYLKTRENMKTIHSDWVKENKDRVAINNRNYRIKLKEKKELAKAEALKAKNPENV